MEEIVAPPSHKVAIFKDGKIEIIELPIYSWYEPTIIPGTPPLISIEDDQKISVFQLFGTKFVAIKETPRTQLVSIAEVKGTGAHLTDGKPRSMSVDINGDERKETITCEVWARWGSLLCTIPLPTGPQKLSTGCDRFGVLATQTNGYNDLVCNHDLVIKYNGKEYIAPETP